MVGFNRIWKPSGESYHVTTMSDKVYGGILIPHSGQVVGRSGRRLV